MNRRLYRSRTDTVLGGVASGLASYLGADPALVRIAWAILVPLTGGAALLAYIVAWVVVPEEPASAMPRPRDATDPGGPVTDPVTDPVTGAPIETAAETGSGWTPPAPVQRWSSDGRAGLIVGAGLILLGLWFLLREYIPDFRWNLVWPFVIVAIGVLVIVSAMRRRPG